MVVGGGAGSFDPFVSRDFALFAGFTAFFSYEVSNGEAVDSQSFEIVEALNFIFNSCIKDLLGEGNEAGVFSYEVGFAVESYDSSEIAGVLRQNATFSSGAVCLRTPAISLLS